MDPARPGVVNYIVDGIRSIQAVMFDTWNEFLAGTQQESGRHVVSGPGLYLNDIDSSVQQARDVVDHGLGWSGYSYANVSLDATASSSADVKDAERAALADALTTEVFTEEAQVPEMTWKTAPTQGIVHGTVTMDGVPADQLELTLRGPGGTRTVTTDATGWFAAVKLEPGQYQVKVADPSSVKGVRPQHVTVTAGDLEELQLSFVGK